MLELPFIILLYLAIVLPSGFFLGKYIAHHFSNDPNKAKTKLEKVFDIIENPIFKICGINKNEEMKAWKYFLSLFCSNMLLSIICFFMLYFQNNLWYRETTTWQLDISLILHILSSAITNTGQTHHIPEIHLTPLSNYFVLPTLMFFSSASGLATGIVFMRSLTKNNIGNAYVDLVKAMTRILFPICFITTIVFVFLGMPNTLSTSLTYETLENIRQTVLMGPVASFEAIKLIGENGQSCFNANSAHPFENPSYISNFLQLICISIIPTALIVTLGHWVKNHKQTAVILFVLFIILIFEFTVTAIYEMKGNPVINSLTNIDSPNWLGKETRLGIVCSSIFEAAKSNLSGSANASLESFHPVATAFALFNLSNQSIFGVQGFGVVFTINFMLYSVFLVGIMLGRTPEIFGKKIEKNEIILSSLLLLINPFLVLIGIAVTLYLYPQTLGGTYENVHYYTRVFFEFASGAASNGSGLEGLYDNTTYWNLSLALVMFFARYGAMASMIFLGNSFINKPMIPASVTTFRTDSLIFVVIFLITTIMLTILTYFPFIILGPLTEIFISR